MKSQSKKRGGTRPGAGKPKGHRAQSTLDKIAAREFVRQRVTAQLGPLVDAHLANALGISYLVVREKKTGKFLRVTQAMAGAKLKKGEELIEVWEKDPSVHAFTYLLDRALDRPQEQEIPIKVKSGDSDARIARLMAARKRTAGK